MPRPGFIIKLDNHDQAWSSALHSLWESEEFLDVTIACDDGQVEAHKVILSAASQFFRSILKRNPHSHPLLYLKGTKTKDMISMLNFIYAGESEITQEELGAFMTLANSLEIQGLVGDVPQVNDEVYEQVDDAEVKEEIQMHEGLVNIELLDTRR